MFKLINDTPKPNYEEKLFGDLVVGEKFEVEGNVCMRISDVVLPHDCVMWNAVNITNGDLYYFSEIRSVHPIKATLKYLLILDNDNVDEETRWSDWDE